MRMLALLLVATTVWGALLPATTASLPHIARERLDDLHVALQRHGGLFDASLGQACPSCARGIIASRDYKEEEDIAVIPLQAGVDLGPESAGSAASLLLAKQQLLPSFNASQVAYFDTVPGPDDVLCLDTFTEAQIELLQSPVLQRLITSKQKDTHNLFHRRGGIQEVLSHVSNGTASTTFSYFQYASGMVTTRYFYFQNPASKTVHRYLMPALDLINHSVRRANVARYQNGWKIFVRTLRAIKAGEELFWIYHRSLLHRPDMSLLLYGYVTEGEVDEPVLAASDRAGFDANSAYADTPLFDDVEEVEDPMLEAVRVEALLDEAGTTLEQDVELLAALRAGKRPAGTEGWTWKEFEIIKFRVARKTALREWLRRLLRRVDWVGGVVGGASRD